MKKFLIILLLTIATVLPTFATNWVQVGDKTYIDIDTIEPFVNDYGQVIPNQYSYWEKTLNNGDFKKLEKQYNKKIWYMLSKNVIDLKRKTSAIKFSVLYDLKENSIDPLEIMSSLMNWQSIVPNTVGELKYMIIKEYIQQRRY